MEEKYYDCCSKFLTKLIFLYLTTKYQRGFGFKFQTFSTDGVYTIVAEEQKTGAENGLCNVEIPNIRY